MDNRDSDQSISDYDEDFNHESFCGPRQKMGLSGNNEIEMPLLHNGNDNFIYNARRIFMTNSDKEMISDDEVNY
ncbi:hypothetical protein NE237_013492 [Protea cynaroides]|uniref:Uncharacterized protein n=1 Tax=Protea cynaroides TaxID=273540 RepID=A0A9Q0H408_9MAGN|nr:hypothetical protein NE237_013492 [Protea cynaroides]